MMNQSFSREVTAALLELMRTKMPEKIFFIKRRSMSEISVCGFVMGSMDTLFFTVKNDGKTILVNPGIPTDELPVAIETARSVAANFSETVIDTKENTISA